MRSLEFLACTGGLPKAWYNLFEKDPEIEFAFFLTHKLGWKSVREMERGLNNLEYIGWAVYFGRIAQRRELEINAMKASG